MKYGILNLTTRTVTRVVESEGEPSHGSLNLKNSEIIIKFKEGLKSQKIKGVRQPTQKRFTKPTPQDVTDYGLSITYSIDGQNFCDFYESKGWKVGNTPMKDWKACVRQWRTRDGGSKSSNVVKGKVITIDE